MMRYDAFADSPQQHRYASMVQTSTSSTTHIMSFFIRAFLQPLITAIRTQPYLLSLFTRSDAVGKIERPSKPRTRLNGKTLTVTTHTLGAFKVWNRCG